MLDVRKGEVVKVPENSKGKSRDRVPRACSSRGGGPGEISWHKCVGEPRYPNQGVTLLF